MTNCIFLGSKITADDDCSHEIKTLNPWKESVTNLDSVLKSQDVTLPAEVLIALVFPEVL